MPTSNPKKVRTTVDFKLLDQDTPDPLPTATLLGLATDAEAHAYEARQIALGTLRKLDDLITALKTKNAI